MTERVAGAGRCRSICSRRQPSQEECRGHSPHFLPHLARARVKARVSSMESPWRQEPGFLRTELLVGFLSAPAPGPWTLRWLMDRLEVGWTLTGKTCRAGGGLEGSHVPGCNAFIETLHLFHPPARFSAPRHIRTAPSALHAFSPSSLSSPHTSRVSPQTTPLDWSGGGLQ